MRRVRLTLVALVLACALASPALAQAPRGTPLLFWIDTNYGAPTLKQADAGGVAYASLALPAGSLPEGLAIDAGGHPYWVESRWTGARVMRAAPTLGATTPLVTGGSVLRGIAVDDVAHYLYWTSSNLATGARIQRANVDGTGVTTILSLALGANPRGIAIDHAGGKMYWADFDQDAIMRANLDGTSIETFYLAPTQSHPYGVAFDPVGLQVYWTEYAGKLRRSTTGGLNSTVAGGLANPTYLAIDPAGGRLFWSEGGAGAQHVMRSNLDGSGKVTLPLPLTTYGGLAFQASYGLPVGDPVAPAELSLAPFAPNPAAPPVVAQFTLPREQRARLSVLDLQGREVAVLVDGVLPAGRHEATWTGGRAIVPGMYFVRLAAGDRTLVRRLVVDR